MCIEHVTYVHVHVPTTVHSDLWRTAEHHAYQGNVHRFKSYLQQARGRVDLTIPECERHGLLLVVARAGCREDAMSFWASGTLLREARICQGEGTKLPSYVAKYWSLTD